MNIHYRFVPKSGQLKFFGLLGVSLVLSFLAAAHFYLSASASVGQPLSFVERVAYERKVQAFYFRHRSKSPENKRTFDDTLPTAASELRITDLLRKSNPLEKKFNLKLTPEMLLAEIVRMSRETRQPEVLREIFAALDNDPRVVAETLARANLVERLTSENPYFKEQWQTDQHNFSTAIAETPFDYNALEVNSNLTFEGDDTWKPMPVLPETTEQDTAIWTGAEKLVWGGSYQNGNSRAGYEYFAQNNARTKFDFVGDGRADISVFLPSDRVWYLLQSTGGL